jgi:FtsH-binding integral membrane protein
MPSTTRLVGVILIVLGLASYFGTGRVSVTALIPAFFGAVLVVLALVAKREAARKHAIHAALVVALIGLIGTLVRLLPAIANGQLGRPAVIAQLVMSLVLAGYIALGVKSFRDARRSRNAKR